MVVFPTSLYMSIIFFKQSISSRREKKLQQQHPKPVQQQQKLPSNVIQHLEDDGDYPLFLQEFRFWSKNWAKGQF